MLPGAAPYAYIGSLLGDVAAVSVDAVDAGLARRSLAEEIARAPLPVPPR